MSKAPKLPDQNRHHYTASYIAGRVLLWALVVLTIIPVLWTLFLSLKTQNEIMLTPLKLPKKWMWANYEYAFTMIPYGKMLKNTMIIIIIALPCGLLHTLFSSFAIARVKVGKAKRNNLFYLYFIAGIVIPFWCTLFPIYWIMVNIGLWNTRWADIIPHVAGATAMCTLLFTASYRDIPDALEEAAVIDGCNIWTLFWKILVPMIVPVLSTMTILNFLGIWNDFALARVMMTDNNLRTIALAASYFKGQYSTDYGLMCAGVSVLLIPQLAVFAFFQRYIMEGVAAGAVKG